MNTNLHPVMASALRPFVQPRRIEPPYEFIADTREIVAPHSGVIPDDMPVAVLSEMGGDEIRIGYLMAAAPEMKAELENARRVLLEANPNCSSEYLFGQIMSAYGFVMRALAKADGITP